MGFLPFVLITSPIVLFTIVISKQIIRSKGGWGETELLTRWLIVIANIIFVIVPILLFIGAVLATFLIAMSFYN